MRLLRLVQRTPSIALMALLPLACAGSDKAISSPRPAAASASIAPSTPPEPLADEPAPPKGKLPKGVRPLAERVTLEVTPKSDRVAGSVEIDVDLAQRRSVVWLHGRDLHATAARVTPADGAIVEARYEQALDDGVVALRLARPVRGRATIHIDFDAGWSTSGEGLYRVEQAGDAYAFTQFEAISARRAFPCFDEPAFKIPWTLTLSVPSGDRAIANAPEASRTVEGARTRVTFAETKPLPSYLVAFAVGPFDVVEAPAIAPDEVRGTPLPFRGVAARGRGKDLAFALAGTPEIVRALEKYTGIAYPYPKLDVIAVPEKRGAMENPGAVTFGEWLLLVDAASAPIDQRRAFRGVMAHELAHQWFGDLVTMPWWDDIWLNEAFATWMSRKVVASIAPADEPWLEALSTTAEAMEVDGLTSARRIRQPIESDDDIVNAFDDITYVKGAQVLAMFERWVGEEPFQRGVHAYLASHAHASATTDDLLAALGEAARRDVATPFKTFLDQPGVPWVETSLECKPSGKAILSLAQSRYLPLGSTGDAKSPWQIPVCARVAIAPSAGKRAEPALRDDCTLLTDARGELAIETARCPAWVLPNDDGAGYFHAGVSGADRKALLADLGHLRASDRMVFADGVRAAFDRGLLGPRETLESLTPLIDARFPNGAMGAATIVRTARDWLFGDPARARVEARGRALYGKLAAALGWMAAPGETPERSLLRRDVLRFMAEVARDPAVRREAARLGRAYVGFGKDGAIHADAVDANLVDLALDVAVEEGDEKLFDALAARLAAERDAVLRGRIVHALASAADPTRAARLRALLLDPRVWVSEVPRALHCQFGRAETRDAAWAWLKANLDALGKRLPSASAGALPWLAAPYCDAAHEAEIRAFFEPRSGAFEGGRRNLAESLEIVHQCVARRAAHGEAMRALFVK